MTTLTEITSLPRRGQGRAYVQLRDQVFGHYGTVCACCGTTENLTIDHVNGGGTKHREELGGIGGIQFYVWLIRNGFPEGFQTLCNPCNISKGNGLACRLKHDTPYQINNPEAPSTASTEPVPDASPDASSTASTEASPEWAVPGGPGASSTASTEPPPLPGTPAAIRVWGRERGWKVGNRGRLSAQLRRDYEAANSIVEGGHPMPEHTNHDDLHTDLSASIDALTAEVHELIQELRDSRADFLAHGHAILTTPPLMTP
jgi:hypothetical protein